MPVITSSYMFNFMDLKITDVCSSAYAKQDPRTTPQDVHFISHALKLGFGRTCGGSVPGCVSASDLLRQCRFIPLPLVEGCLMFQLKTPANPNRARDKILSDSEIARVWLLAGGKAYCYTTTSGGSWSVMPADPYFFESRIGICFFCDFPDVAAVRQDAYLLKI